MTASNANGVQRRTFMGRVMAGLALIGAATARKAEAADPPTPVPSPRLGLCVADLQKSVDFYTKALGFKNIGQAQSVGKALATAMQTDSPLNVAFVQRGGLAIELLHFADHKTAVHHPMDQPGLTNLTIAMESLEPAVTLVKQYGGTIIEPTHTRFGVPGNGAYIVFCEDPDGVRIGLEAIL
jgi:glyoxylase I family protein